jgi:crotonobetainyl-CoA:carnitine CoA-transferase CaiB-like acyl-CoA transferase
MAKPMAGVRIVEVAQFAFVPVAGAVLAEWGAEVVKIEHAVRGDAARGLTTVGGALTGDANWEPFIEHCNRGKRSVGLDLAKPGGLGSG